MDGRQIAETIIQQMGGYGKLKAMINAKDFLYSDKEKSLQFKFSGSKKVNCIKITLNNLDLYDIKLYKINLKKFTCDVKEKIENIYADQLKDIFETKTGLYLSL